jgi:hypothetical protein
MQAIEGKAHDMAMFLDALFQLTGQTLIVLNNEYLHCCTHLSIHQDSEDYVWPETSPNRQIWARELKRDANNPHIRGR